MGAVFVRFNKKPTKEAMIKAKEALHNEREQLNEDERERRREFAIIETKLSKKEDLIETKNIKKNIIKNIIVRLDIPIWKKIR